MKKLLACILTLVLTLTCLTACDKYAGEVTRENVYGMKDNCTVFTFDNFCGTYRSREMRINDGEGALYYQVNLTSGELSVSYRTDWLSDTQPLVTAKGGVLLDSSGGYIERDGQIDLIFEADTPVSGEVIISFVPIE